MALINRPKRVTETIDNIEDGKHVPLDVTRDDTGEVSSAAGDEVTDLCLTLKERIVESIKPNMATSQVMDLVHVLKIHVDAIEAAHLAALRQGE